MAYRQNTRSQRSSRRHAEETTDPTDGKRSGNKNFSGSREHQQHGSTESALPPRKPTRSRFFSFGRVSSRQAPQLAPVVASSTSLSSYTDESQIEKSESEKETSSISKSAEPERLRQTGENTEDRSDGIYRGTKKNTKTKSSGRSLRQTISARARLPFRRQAPRLQSRHEQPVPPLNPILRRRLEEAAARKQNVAAVESASTESQSSYSNMPDSVGRSLLERRILAARLPPSSVSASSSGSQIES